VSTSASDGDAPTLAKGPKKTTAKETKKNLQAVSSSNGDAALRKENKKLQVAAKKAKATADNLKKKTQQDSQPLKVLKDEIKALKDEVKSLKPIDPERNPQPVPTNSTVAPMPAAVPVVLSTPEPEVQP
jgi:hypothetical protein